VRPEILLVSGLVLALSASLTRAVRAFCWKHGWLDVPNERSSHVVATARGGGLSIVIAATCALLALRWLHAIDTDLLLALIGGGGAVAIVGLVDDQRRLSGGIRLSVHFAAGLWALICLGGLPPLAFGGHVVNLGWAGHVLGLLGIVWSINLLNFMDGIDGIAASEAVFIICSGVLLTLAHGQSTQLPGVGLAFGAACLGFLLWNWPPASIFMGDVGSGYLGYVISVLAIAAARDNPAAVWIWLTLGGVFFVDATVTLVRRAIRGERLHEAHRSHAYQRLARLWGSHRRVTVTLVLVNVAWLLPCAWLAALHPGAAMWISVGALAPLVILAVGAGSGRREGNS
jgi:Fuc2NAc and GlcNAc transferase